MGLFSPATCRASDPGTILVGRTAGEPTGGEGLWGTVNKKVKTYNHSLILTCLLTQLMAHSFHHSLTISASHYT